MQSVRPLVISSRLRQAVSPDPEHSVDSGQRTGQLVNRDLRWSPTAAILTAQPPRPPGGTPARALNSISRGKFAHVLRSPPTARRHTRQIGTRGELSFVTLDVSSRRVRHSATR